jgi:ferredoxin
VRFLDAACLRLRSHRSNCDACVSACPVDAIRIDPTQTRVGDACTGCGRCAAVCPTHALDVPGFRIGEVPSRPGERRPVTIDCWKVPREAAEPDAVRVPCLGGLRVSDLLEVCAAAAPRPVRLLDRGWCAGCSSGGGRHPAAANLDQARELLADVGAASEGLPGIESRPLPGRLMPSDIPPPDQGAPVSRRGFLRHLAGRSAAVIEQACVGDGAGDAVPAFSSHAARPRTERSAVLGALSLVARETGAALPGRLFPMAEATGACRNHNICVAHCPTRALRKYAGDDGAAGILFEAAECIECRLCEMACPERAIAIRSGTRLAPPSGPETVTRHRLATCWHCGASFAPHGEESHCAPCGKSRDFAAAAYQELFAAR